jgi:hypothetical protein
MSDRPVYFDQIHDEIYRFAKKYNLDANEVGKVFKKILEEKTKKVFAQDFSKKPKQRHYHDGGH